MFPLQNLARKGLILAVSLLSTDYNFLSNTNSHAKFYFGNLNIFVYIYVCDSLFPFVTWTTLYEILDYSTLIS